MPAKLFPPESFVSASAQHRRPRNMAELNAMNDVFEISNNIINYVYVFEDSPLQQINGASINDLDEREARNALIHDIFDSNDDNSLNGLRSKRSNESQLESSSNFQDLNKKRNEIDSMNTKSSDTSDSLIDLSALDDEHILKTTFSPALPNGKNYRPVCGFQSKLCNGSRFVGFQRTKHNHCYGVEVVLNYVDLQNFYICGHLSINGLTDEYPTLTTFFDGEIISARYPFLTRKYDADSEIDRNHWARLIPDKQFARMFRDEYDYSNMADSNYVFMRWKERHLVKDHRVNEISGCSFAGFYYILFSKRTGSIEGFYYHKNSELLQRLSLKHNPDRTSKICEIR